MEQLSFKTLEKKAFRSFFKDGIYDVFLGLILQRNFCSDEKRVLKKWWKYSLDQIKKPLSGHFDLISRYVESLEKGAPSPVTGEDGRNAVKLLECIEESLKEKRPVAYSPW